jgi:hypothetical protein
MSEPVGIGRSRPHDGRYILDGKRAVSEPRLLVWARWFGNINNRRVAQNYYQRHGRRIWVSTVFLALDYNFDSGPPVLFETMVFDDSHLEISGYTARYSTYEEAEAGHERIYAQAKVEVLGCRPFPGYEPSLPIPDSYYVDLALQTQAARKDDGFNAEGGGD